MIEHSGNVLETLGVKLLLESVSNCCESRKTETLPMEQMVVDFCQVVNSCQECPFDAVVPNTHSCCSYAVEKPDVAIQIMTATGHLIVREDGTYIVRGDGTYETR